MAQTHTITTYHYHELSEKAKEKALQHFAWVNVDHDWWDIVYEDAKQIGLDIEAFDTDHRTIEGQPIMGFDESIKAILTDHGESCETYRLAKEYQRKATKRIRRDVEAFETLIMDYWYAIKQEYLDTLRKEYDYQTSQEAIEETIKCNEYEFHADGRQYY